MATPPVIGLTTECLAFTQTLVFLLFLWKQWQRHHSICSDTDYGSMYVQNEGGMPDHQKLRPSETLNVIPQLRGRGASHTSQPDHKHLWKFWPFPPWNMILWCSKHIPLINFFQVGGQVDESEASVLLGGLGGDGEHSFFSYLIIALVVLAALACCCCSYAVIELWWFDNHADMITEWDVL